MRRFRGNLANILACSQYFGWYTLGAVAGNCYLIFFNNIARSELSESLSAGKQILYKKAQAFCEEKGARFTPLRARIYEILLNEDSSIGAYDLLDKLKRVEDSAKPPTVYRALDFFLELGLVHKVESTNTFKACHHFGCSHPVQFLICDGCGDVQEISSDGVKTTLEAQAMANSFHIISQTIEAHGLCGRCQTTEGSI